MVDKRKQGKRNRANGKAFELKVREDLESKGWIVFRNSNDVEFETFYDDEGFKIPYVGGVKIGKFKQAKSKWNHFTHSPMTLQSGFPDFVCIKQPFDKSQSAVNFYNTPINGYITEHKIFNNFSVIFVECKTNGTLDKVEREKVEWIKNNLKIPVIIAIKIKEGRKVVVKYE